MAHVSLILPTTLKAPLTLQSIPTWRRGLEAAGHSVEVVVAGPPASEPAEPSDDLTWRWVPCAEPGLAAAAVSGLRAADGDLLLLLDPAMGYTPEDLGRVVERLERGEADLAVGSRFHLAVGETDGPRPGPIRRCAGAMIRPLVGTSDPMSGLIGLNREQANRLAESLQPVGSKFAVEVLTRSEVCWVEVPVGARWPSRRSGLGFDDLRQFKRLADHRYGNMSRLVQFCVVGASGMVVDLSCYAFFQWLFAHSPLAGRPTPVIGGSLALTLSAVLSVGLALTWNFSLNRRLTFSYARQGSIVGQFITYALSNFLGVALSLTLRLMLPRYSTFFNAHKLAAALVGIVTATGISFTMSRWLVFRHRTPSGPATTTVTVPDPEVGQAEPLVEPELDAVAAAPLGAK